MSKTSRRPNRANRHTRRSVARVVAMVAEYEAASAADRVRLADEWAADFDMERAELVMWLETQRGRCGSA